jgi:hypothetical protein
MSAFGGKADMSFCGVNVRFVTQSGHLALVGYLSFASAKLQWQRSDVRIVSRRPTRTLAFPSSGLSRYDALS